MWASQYFTGRYWAARFWSRVTQTAPVIADAYTLDFFSVAAVGRWLEVSTESRFLSVSVVSRFLKVAYGR